MRIEGTLTLVETPLGDQKWSMNMAAASSVAVVVVARVVAGLGAALMMPATLSVLTDVFAPADTSRSSR